MARLSNRSFALAIACGVVVFLTATSDSLAQETVPSPSPVPDPTYRPAEGTFVPFDVLLQQADARRPLTAEGWIVQEPPLQAWSLGIDPAKRAYENFEYVVRLRQYDSQIRLARAELDSWRRRLTVYRYFNEAGALFVTYENAFLSLIHAEEQLRNLRYERMLFVRRHQQKIRYPATETVVEG